MENKTAHPRLDPEVHMQRSCFHFSDPGSHEVADCITPRPPAALRDLAKKPLLSGQHVHLRA